MQVAGRAMLDTDNVAHSQYISDSLIHWTGRKKSDEAALQILKTICKESILRLTYCPRYVQQDLRPSASMVCFTDIPLRFSGEHCGLFGQCGIAFQKSAMIAYGANPVFYTTSKHLARIKHIDTLVAGMRELEKDREWKEEVEPYRFTEDETIALMEVTDFQQEYSYENKDDVPYVTYYQREWRLPFNILPFAGDDKPHEPGMSCFYSRDGKSYPIFKFRSADVAFLVVPRAYQETVSELARDIGCKVRIFEDDVDAEHTRRPSKSPFLRFFLRLLERKRRF
jgi:hypothetical protein